MRLDSILLMMCLFSSATAQTDVVPAPIHAGPVYTSGEGSGGYPKYPELQVQVELPPEISPDVVKPEDFQIVPDGLPPVTANRKQTLASTGYGMAVLVSIDVSGSMKGAPLDAIRASLSKFVNSASPADKIAIQTIADEGRWDAAWDASRDQDRIALANLAARGTRTRLWDALFEAIGTFPAAPEARRLTVISDGHDEGSAHTEQEVIAVAGSRGVVLDAVGMTRSNPFYLQTLKELALKTGGQFSQAKSPEQLQQLVSSGIERLKLTPVVSFHVEDLAGDGKAHRFTVIWKHDGIESRGQVTAVIPLLSGTAQRRFWLWGAAAGAALLVSILLLLARSRRMARQENRQSSELAKPSFPPQPSLASPGYAAPQPETPFQHPLSPRPPLQPRQVPTSGETVSTRGSKTEFVTRFPHPAIGRPAAWLLCEEGFAAGRRFPLDQTEYWIGALESNHLRIADDPTVSANHACLVFDHDVLGIYDHQSTNGTRVNGDLIDEKRRLLRPGDRIRIGRSTFLVQPLEQETPKR